MNRYSCKVVDKNGKKITVIHMADDTKTLTEHFRAEGLFLYEYAALDGKDQNSRKLKSKTVLEFTQTVSLLLDSGLTLKETLKIGNKIFTTGEVAQLLDVINGRIEKGHSFVDIIESNKDSFSPLYVGLIRVGEKIGSLKAVFHKLSDYLKEQKKIKEKITGALIYPCMILCLMVFGLFGLIVFIFPKVETMFSQMGGSAQEKLSSAIFNAKIFISVFFVLFLSIGLSIPLLFFLKKSDRARALWIDSFLLKIPFVGKIILTLELSKFLYATETLTMSGIKVENALEEASQVMSNEAIRQDIKRICTLVEKGQPLSSAFLESKIFPEKIGCWMAVGESSGKIDTVFSQLKEYYQGDLDKLITILLNIVEPALIIFIGMIMMVVVVFVIGPVLTISTSIM